MALFARRISDLGTENAFRIGDDIVRCTAAGINVVRLHIGEPDFETAPHINEAAIEQIRAGNTHYSDPQGLLSFRQAIAEQIQRTRGVPMDASRIVVTPGTKPTIGYTLQAYIDAGDEVIYPSPGFPIYESRTSYAGAIPVPLPLHEDTGFTFTPDDLAALITPRTKVIMLCSPSNPTGGVLSKSDLEGIAAVIRERCSPDVRIYSDEIYEHILFDGETHHSIAAEEGMAERTVIASGHSKGYAMTGWRLGYAALPTAEEAAIFTRLNINSISCVPPFIQEAGRVALTSPASEPFIARMCAEFQERRDWVVAALNDIPGIHCQNPKGAFYTFPNVAGACQTLGILDTYDRLEPEVQRQTSPARMLQMFLLYRYGVSTMDRRSFGAIGSEGQHFLRLSVGTTIDRLQEGVARIARGVVDPAGCAAFLRESEYWR